MENTITFYFVSGESATTEAKEQVESLNGVRVIEMNCPSEIRDFYRVPFIREESGKRHFGLDGIKRFVMQRKACT